MPVSSDETDSTALGLSQALSARIKSPCFSLTIFDPLRGSVLLGFIWVKRIRNTFILMADSRVFEYSGSKVFAGGIILIGVLISARTVTCET